MMKSNNDATFSVAQMDRNLSHTVENMQIDNKKKVITFDETRAHTTRRLVTRMLSFGELYAYQMFLDFPIKAAREFVGWIKDGNKVEDQVQFMNLLLNIYDGKLNLSVETREAVGRHNNWFDTRDALELTTKQIEAVNESCKVVIENALAGITIKDYLINDGNYEVGNCVVFKEEHGELTQGVVIEAQPNGPVSLGVGKDVFTLSTLDKVISNLPLAQVKDSNPNGYDAFKKIHDSWMNSIEQSKEAMFERIQKAEEAEMERQAKIASSRAAIEEATTLMKEFEYVALECMGKVAGMLPNVVADYIAQLDGHKKAIAEAKALLKGHKLSADERSTIYGTGKFITSVHKELTTRSKEIAKLEAAQKREEAKAAKAAEAKVKAETKKAKAEKVSPDSAKAEAQAEADAKEVAEMATKSKKRGTAKKA